MTEKERGNSQTQHQTAREQLARTIDRLRPCRVPSKRHLTRKRAKQTDKLA